MMQTKKTGYPSIDKPWLEYYPNDCVVQRNREVSVFRFFLEKNKNNMEYSAIQYFGRTISYRQLVDNIMSCANSLYKNGIREGDYVTIQALTMPQTVVLFYAISYIGAVANFLYIDMKEDDVIYNLVETQSKLYFTLSGLDLDLERIRKESCVNNIVSISIADEADWFLKALFKMKKNRKKLS